jgi:2-desacetyl-2-hydroxyethyl bacteriochlorophyllide A dehydrogenase
VRAVTIAPRRPGSLRLDDIAGPAPGKADLLVKTLAVGICGTDRDLIDGHYGEAPPGEERLVLGHESLGRVVAAPEAGEFSKGDLLVGIVRHPDPVPCVNCAVGEWDMCRNGRYTERGIKQAHGFASDLWVSKQHHLVKIEASLGLAGVLLEPASVLAKAWEHIERIGKRARWAPERVLVTGAGPVGLLAALMGVQRGLEVHVQDHNEGGPKPSLVKELGASYHTKAVEMDFDVAIECTGVPGVIRQVLEIQTPNSIVCLAGLSAAPSEVKLDVAPFNQSMVLRNRVVFGTVNANRRHYQAAAEALARAGRTWLERLISRKVSLRRWEEAYEKRPGDVKTVLLFED